MAENTLSESATSTETRRSFWSCALIGAGIMAAVDEILFHQLLGWHHFYDLSTPMVGLFSDGLLHTAELVALIAGFLLFSDLRRRQALAVQWAWAGVLFGAGVFQLFDGLVDHKLLRLHQIRYGVDNLIVYDILWNLFGAILLVIGLLALRRARKSSGAD